MIIENILTPKMKFIFLVPRQSEVCNFCILIFLTNIAVAQVFKKRDSHHLLKRRILLLFLGDGTV